jgi:hypothetical protein
MKFTPHVIDATYTNSRVAAGDFKKGGWAEVFFSPGESKLPAKWYERVGERWVGHALLPFELDHAHTLRAGDINGDGNLDVLLGEEAMWPPERTIVRNPLAHVWVFYGDGKGGFTQQVVHEGQGVHEGRLGDLDGDGDLDILGKPIRHNMPRQDVWINGGTSASRER